MVEVALDTEDLAGSGLRLEIDGAVATITLIRPERRNAQTPAMWRALARIGDTLPVGIRVVVVRGEGPSFSSGIDLRAFTPEGVPGEDAPLPADAAPEEIDRTIAGYQRGFTWLRRPAIVSIAAVRGHAIGAGFQLALACDLRIVADDASFCMKEPALGLVPDLTGTKPLVDTVGLARALEMCLTVRTVPAEEARELGIAQAVVPGDELDDAVRDLTAALLQVDAGAAAATKSLLQQAPGNTLDEQAATERRAQIDRLRALGESR
ncbi:MAG TPA: enoyl-CoA hydratase/isomerase family protein [Streptosporangiaceae bacterium]|jgi:enoyl-CoA hydratase/carnithine racemase|nr:enoyl-CoA hydratase/isomerase family protein [Streptosporangiaceae bacterium]